MKLSKRQIKRILREALNDAPYVEEAQLEDVLLECFTEWMLDGPAHTRTDYKFNDFVNDVAKRLGLSESMLWAAIEEMRNR